MAVGSASTAGSTTTDQWVKKGKVMSERGTRRRLSDVGLFFVTLVITVVMCALWVAASAADVAGSL
jgi:hypothetical protein